MTFQDQVKIKTVKRNLRQIPKLGTQSPVAIVSLDYSSKYQRKMLLKYAMKREIHTLDITIQVI